MVASRSVELRFFNEQGCSNIHFCDADMTTFASLTMNGRLTSAVVPVASLIAIERTARTPLHRQIYEAYRSAIGSGTLRPGQRVPSTRALASDLGVSRMPVLSAYDQLMAEGYFRSRVGAGTSVSELLPYQKVPVEGDIAGQKVRAAKVRSVKIASRTSLLDSMDTPPWNQNGGPFSVGQIPCDQFPFAVWNRLMSRHCRRTTTKSLDHSHPMGFKGLREVLSEYLRTARGVHCDSKQIMIVSGSQQAIDLAVRVLLDPGSRVWIEEPGYRYAWHVLALNGCHPIPVSVDDEGLDVAEGILRCKDARAALVTPTHQFPMGVSMSAARRFQLLEWAERSEGWILEDDYDSDFRYEGVPVSSLQGLDVNSRVVYIGTFSNVLFPPLRIGYLVIPNDLVERFLTVRFAMDIAPPTLYQAALADFIGEGHFGRHIRKMRLLYREHRDVLVRSIRKELPFVEVMGERAGMHLCITVKGILDRDIVNRAAKANLDLVPLSLSYIGKAVRQGFILGYGSTSIDQLDEAVQRLRGVLSEACNATDAEGT